MAVLDKNLSMMSMNKSVGTSFMTLLNLFDLHTGRHEGYPY